MLLAPGQVVWADVTIAPGDPCWDDDVGRAFHWLGRTWADALRSLGASEVGFHQGRPVSSAWSRLACFAGLGAGEVTAGGRKVVGLSQRRTREGALFQCACLVTTDQSGLVDLLAIEDAERRQLERELVRGSAGLDAALGAVEQPAIETAFLAAVAVR